MLKYSNLNRNSDYLIHQSYWYPYSVVHWFFPSTMGSQSCRTNSIKIQNEKVK